MIYSDDPPPSFYVGRVGERAVKHPYTTKTKQATQAFFRETRTLAPKKPSEDRCSPRLRFVSAHGFGGADEPGESTFLSTGTKPRHLTAELTLPSTG